MANAPKGLKLAAAAFAATVALFAVTLSLALYMKSVSQQENHQENCAAITAENEILRDLVVRAENQSIAALKEPHPPGENMQSVLGLFNPTIERIDSVQC